MEREKKKGGGGLCEVVGLSSRKRAIVVEAPQRRTRQQTRKSADLCLITPVYHSGLAITANGGESGGGGEGVNLSIHVLDDRIAKLGALENGGVVHEPLKVVGHRPSANRAVHALWRK